MFVWKWIKKFQISPLIEVPLYLHKSSYYEEQVKEAKRTSILDGSWILCDSQHFDLIEWPDWPHLSQVKLRRWLTEIGSLWEANLTKISIRLVSKLFFLAKFSRYFLISLLQDSVPSSEKSFKQNLALDSRINSSEWANILCRVGMILTQWNESKKYLFTGSPIPEYWLSG